MEFRQLFVLLVHCNLSYSKLTFLQLHFACNGYKSNS
jgi:hypothetical protein